MEFASSYLEVFDNRLLQKLVFQQQVADGGKFVRGTDVERHAPCYQPSSSGTDGLFTGISQAVDKQFWFVESHNF